MLHFLATIALCIFIGERVGHYVSARRYWREVAEIEERRLMASVAPSLRQPPKVKRGYPWIGAGSR